MRTFIRNILIILAPSIVLLSYVLTIFVSHNLHWFYTRDDLGEKFLLGEPYNEEFAAYYKLHKNLDEYKILAIGSSRVLQFSEDMFKEKFFNLGYLAGSVPQIQHLIENRDIRNKVLIIGIDQWALNASWPYAGDKEFSSSGDILDPAVLLSRNKIEDVLKGKVYPVFRSTNEIGLIGSGANLAMSGILPDGSYYYGKIYHGNLTNNRELTGRDYGFMDVRNRIKNGNLRFEYGENVDANALQAVRDLIVTCRNRNNKVYLFFPPFPPSIVGELNSSKYSYMPAAAAGVSRFCDSLGVGFYDFTKMDAPDSDFVDGLHGGKQVYYNLLRQMNFPVQHITFLNPFETVADSAYTNLRVEFFSGSTKF